MINTKLEEGGEKMTRDKAKVNQQKQITKGLRAQIKELAPYVKITREHKNVLSKDHDQIFIS